MLLDAAKLRFGNDRAEEQAHVEKDNAVDIVTQTDEAPQAHPQQNQVVKNRGGRCERFGEEYAISITLAQAHSNVQSLYSLKIYIHLFNKNPNKI